MRLRKPCLVERFRLFGWNVRFMGNSWLRATGRGIYESFGLQHKSALPVQVSRTSGGRPETAKRSATRAECSSMQTIQNYNGYHVTPLASRVFGRAAWCRYLVCRLEPTSQKHNRSFSTGDVL